MRKNDKTFPFSLTNLICFRTWREGELFIFDDSFEHEVWHNGSQSRLVLILDMWHPQLSAAQRRSLSPI